MKELLYHDFVEKLKKKEYVSGTYQIFMESKDSFAQIAALLEEGNYRSYEMKIYQERDGKRITCIFPNEMIELSVQEPQVAYSTKRPIPIGVSDYRKLKEKNYYCIDKTRMIEELLQINAEATLITRPRRFGKTTNMNMLSEFFDISKQSQDLFKDTYIAKTEYASDMNQWPVIVLSFRNAKGDKTQIIKNIKEMIMMEFNRHAFALESMSRIDQILCSRIFKTYEDQSNQSLRGMNTAILFLSKKLYDYYNKATIILVDDYDTPFFEANLNHCYEELRYDLSTLLSSVLKDNEYLNFAVMTGIQRISYENGLTGLNNLEICTIQDDQYADIFGFTEDETRTLLSFYGRTFDTKVNDMYDGYTIGNYEIYNPWSILKYAKLGKLDAYWIHTASNQIIKDLMRFHDENFTIKYDELITTGETTIQTDLSESYIYGDSSGIWSLLIHAGYVTIIESLEEGTYHIRIVNQEIRQDFISITTYGLGITGYPYRIC